MPFVKGNTIGKDARFKAGLEYGDTFDQASNMKGPGTAEGAHGESVSLYLFDPNHHLIELLYCK